MSAAIAALVLLAPAVAHGMTEIGAVVEPVPVRVFPIAGPHDLGRSPTNGFGGGRGHTGQDMFAACGTPVVASQGGKIRKAGYDAGGGNFIVLTEKHTGLDAVYMHLANRPRVRAREKVETNKRIGSVGDTGNADGCHLHFELSTAPGWYAGGQPFDPLPASGTGTRARPGGGSNLFGPCDDVPVAFVPDDFQPPCDSLRITSCSSRSALSTTRTTTRRGRPRSSTSGRRRASRTVAGRAR